MQTILFKDKKRYTEIKFNNEREFEKLVFNNSKIDTKVF